MKANGSPTAAQDAAFCSDLVRGGDKDRWLTALFAPEGPRRDGLMALYAWNLEVARIADSVREPMLGQIRLQWWREAFDDIRVNAPRPQPIVRAMHHAFPGGGPDQALVDRLLDARERDISAEVPADMAALEGYAGATAGALAVLAGHCLAADRQAIAGSDAEQALRAAGTAYGLAGLMRAVPLHVDHGRILLPLAELKAAGLAAENLVHQQRPAGLFTVIGQVCARAGEYLSLTRRLTGAMTPPLRRNLLPALLPAALAALDLGRLRRCGFDPHGRQAHAPVPLRQWVLLRAALLKRP